MKTALTQFIEWIPKENEFLLNKANELLFIEAKQIIEAYFDGMHNEIFNNEKTGKQYYDENYVNND